MDKAYVDFKALFKFNQSQAFWVSRPKVERADLRQLITRQDFSTNSNQNVKGLSLFDDF
ncbi:hypothetical protein [Parabacteroides sp. ZJ-118]|uniref:hypothetical protein n=1 Tax=Parabacteroides sp. ZJ-118 TaxID=2709398 RepID=UPI001F14FF23|nr:hypothetical protein [Parabacteroides sp. ZJ-118]